VRYWAFEFVVAVFGLIIVGGLATLLLSWLALKVVHAQPKRRRLFRPPSPSKIKIEKAPTPPRIPFDELVHLEEIHLATPLPLEPPRHRPPLKVCEDPVLRCRSCGFALSGRKLKNEMRCPFCHGYHTKVTSPRRRAAKKHAASTRGSSNKQRDLSSSWWRSI
jgi:hypothetical protein